MCVVDAVSYEREEREGVRHLTGWPPHSPCSSQPTVLNGCSAAAPHWCPTASGMRARLQSRRGTARCSSRRSLRWRARWQCRLDRRARRSADDKRTHTEQSVRALEVNGVGPSAPVGEPMQQQRRRTVHSNGSSSSLSAWPTSRSADRRSDTNITDRSTSSSASTLVMVWDAGGDHWQSVGVRSPWLNCHAHTHLRAELLEDPVKRQRTRAQLVAEVEATILGAELRGRRLGYLH